jgi:hypothetical protein
MSLSMVVSNWSSLANIFVVSTVSALVQERWLILQGCAITSAFNEYLTILETQVQTQDSSY